MTNSSTFKIQSMKHSKQQHIETDSAEVLQARKEKRKFLKLSKRKAMQAKLETQDVGS